MPPPHRLTTKQPEQQHHDKGTVSQDNQREPQDGEADTGQSRKETRPQDEKQPIGCATKLLVKGT